MIVNQITPIRPPRVRTITFLPCNCCIYCMELMQYRTLFWLANSSIPIQPCIQFLFVSSGFCVRLPSDSWSSKTPLPFANSSYCQVCSGLSPPSYSPCRAHQLKAIQSSVWLFPTSHLKLVLRSFLKNLATHKLGTFIASYCTALLNK